MQRSSERLSSCNGDVASHKGVLRQQRPRHTLPSAAQCGREVLARQHPSPGAQALGLTFLRSDEMMAGETMEIAGHRISEIALELHRYLKYRAEQEQNTYELYPEFFAEALRRGVRSFFGCVVNSRGIATDTKRFDLWHRWLQQR
jgi:hypothetical protein